MNYRWSVGDCFLLWTWLHSSGSLEWLSYLMCTSAFRGVALGEEEPVYSICRCDGIWEGLYLKNKMIDRDIKPGHVSNPYKLHPLITWSFGWENACWHRSGEIMLYVLPWFAGAARSDISSEQNHSWRYLAERLSDVWQQNLQCSNQGILHDRMVKLLFSAE